jgi:chromosome segregation ATPase
MAKPRKKAENAEEDEEPKSNPEGATSSPPANGKSQSPVTPDSDADGKANEVSVERNDENSSYMTSKLIFLLLSLVLVAGGGCLCICGTVPSAVTLARAKNLTVCKHTWSSMDLLMSNIKNLSAPNSNKLVKEIVDLRSETESLHNQIRILEQANQTLTFEVMELRVKLRKERSRVMKLKHDLSSKDDNGKTLDLIAQIENLKSNSISGLERIRDLSKQLEEKDTLQAEERRALTDRISLLSQERDALYAELRELQRNYDSLVKSQEALRKHQEAIYHRDLKAFESEKSKLRGNIDDLQEKYNDLEKECPAKKRRKPREQQQNQDNKFRRNVIARIFNRKGMQKADQ